VHRGRVRVPQPEQDVLVERVRPVGVAGGPGEGEHVGDLRGAEAVGPGHLGFGAAHAVTVVRSVAGAADVGALPRVV
jgi:hypothetical protein